MTKTELERLAVLEQRVDEMDRKVDIVRVDICGVDSKLDDLNKLVTDALNSKADKSEVETLRNLLIKVLLGVAGFAVVTLVGLMIWFFQQSVSVK